MLFEITGYLVGVLLAIQSYWDLRYKEIPLCVSMLGGVAGLGSSFYLGRDVADIMLALLPGLVCLFLGKITRQAVGYGDGILLLVLAMYYSISDLLSICMIACFCAGFVGLVLFIVFHKKGNYELPFVPFLLLAWCVQYLTS